MSRLDQEIMWATSGTGEDFQCVHVDFAREQEAEIERLTAYQNETAKAWTKLTESQEEEIAKLHERCEAYKGQVKSGEMEIERLKADRKELQDVYNALGIGGNMSPVAEIAKLRAVIEDAIHTMEAMNIYAGNPLYNRLVLAIDPGVNETREPGQTISAQELIAKLTGPQS